MKHLSFLIVLILSFIILSCKSTLKSNTNDKPLEETLDEKNRVALSLLTRIRKLPGITVNGGIPLFTKGNNSVLSNGEPLYILDEYPVGNSFKSVNGLVESINIKKVEAFSESDASFYGSRASSGVIKITTYQ